VQLLPSRAGMGRRRLTALFGVVAVVALAFMVGAISDARAGIGDDVCPDAHGEDTNTCPPGQVGVPYSITFKLPEGQGCGPGQDSWSVVGGAAPPGLSMSSSGTLSGPPTQAGVFVFDIQMSLPDTPNCNGTRDTTQRRMTLTINPAIPRLVLGPGSTAPATTGVVYSLQMTASIPDAKTFSISGGALPPGLALDAATGFVAGTPTTAGTYAFTVYAKANGDARSDTKSLQIVVRDPLTITTGAPFESGRALGEVRVPLESTWTSSGGSGTYTWALTTGTLPPGVLFTNGSLSGAPRTAGTYPFAVSVTDSEGRTANVAARISVASALTVTTAALRPARVGKAYATRLRTSAGVKPIAWKIRAGKLPGGVRFDRVVGSLTGVPKKAGRYRLSFEARDSQRVVARRTLTLTVNEVARPRR
jgi:hypothetical protein